MPKLEVILSSEVAYLSKEGFGL